MAISEHRKSQALTTLSILHADLIRRKQEVGKELEALNLKEAELLAKLQMGKQRSEGEQG